MFYYFDQSFGGLRVKNYKFLFTATDDRLAATEPGLYRARRLHAWDLGIAHALVHDWTEVRPDRGLRYVSGDPALMPVALNPVPGRPWRLVTRRRELFEGRSRYP